MMSTSYKRQRTSSNYEERNVSDFVDSCVNFKSNVTFHTPAEGKQLANETLQRTGKESNVVLLLGNAYQLLDKKKLSGFFPYCSPAVEAALSSLPGGGVHVVEITPHVRVLVGVVSSVASRHNCPLRPDSISSLVRDALRHVRNRSGEGASSGVLDIYCCEAENRLCVAAAIARAANKNFSAKCGYAEKGYWERGTLVRVVFAPNTTARTYHEAEGGFGCGSRHALETLAFLVQLCQRLVDAPACLLDTTTFVEIAAAYAAKLKAQGRAVSFNIMCGEELRENGYGGIYGVGKAAEFPPCLVTLLYQPQKDTQSREKVAFVGKGIVYDTGGLSLKSSSGMCGMKRDMGGAAAVFCGFLGLAMLDAPVEVASLLCLADNAMGPRAQRNDDIIRMKSGKTVEINNTDAEGRLVLGDGVYHASALLSFQPDVIVDMATLTGAQGVTTGRHHAALYTNEEGIETRLLQAGRLSGDLCFPVLHCPEFHCAEFFSRVADSRNGVGSGSNASVSCAAYFVGSHLDPRFKGAWAHVDMASPVAHDDATGYGVALLLQTFASSIYSSG